jgi:prepilin-type N-terminal cleavage/methylation domain-containing protein
MCSLSHRHQSPATRSRAAGFTLIELLVVIAIIAILAGLGFAGISGALKTAKKAETRAMANQIKLAINTFYSEYGYYPQVTRTDSTFYDIMTGAPARTNVNPRRTRFLEVPPKFLLNNQIVTPARLYADGSRPTFSIAVDTNYSGSVRAGTRPVPVPNTTVAVWVADPDGGTNDLRTW